MADDDSSPIREVDASMEKIAKTLDAAGRRDLPQQVMKRVVDVKAS